jgi:hypothetical protein
LSKDEEILFETAGRQRRPAARGQSVDATNAPSAVIL